MPWKKKITDKITTTGKPDVPNNTKDKRQKSYGANGTHTGNKRINTWIDEATKYTLELLKNDKYNYKNLHKNTSLENIIKKSLTEFISDNNIYVAYNPDNGQPNRPNPKECATAMAVAITNKHVDFSAKKKKKLSYLTSQSLSAKKVSKKDIKNNPTKYGNQQTTMYDTLKPVISGFLQGKNVAFPSKVNATTLDLITNEVIKSINKKLTDDSKNKLKKTEKTNLENNIKAAIISLLKDRNKLFPNLPLDLKLLFSNKTKEADKTSFIQSLVISIPETLYDGNTSKATIQSSIKAILLDKDIKSKDLINNPFAKQTYFIAAKVWHELHKNKELYPVTMKKSFKSRLSDLLLKNFEEKDIDLNQLDSDKLTEIASKVALRLENENIIEEYAIGKVKFFADFKVKANSNKLEKAVGTFFNTSRLINNRNLPKKNPNLVKLEFGKTSQRIALPLPGALEFAIDSNNKTYSNCALIALSVYKYIAFRYSQANRPLIINDGDNKEEIELLKIVDALNTGVEKLTKIQQHQFVYMKQSTIDLLANSIATDLYENIAANNYPLSSKIRASDDLSDNLNYNRSHLDNTLEKLENSLTEKASSISAFESHAPSSSALSKNSSKEDKIKYMAINVVNLVSAGKDGDFEELIDICNKAFAKALENTLRQTTKTSFASLSPEKVDKSIDLIAAELGNSTPESFLTEENCIDLFKDKMLKPIENSRNPSYDGPRL